MKATIKTMMIAMLAGMMLLAGVANAGPLHDAARVGNVATIKRLIAEGANVNAEFRYAVQIEGKTYYSFETPLRIAAENGHVVAIKALLDAGAKVNAKTDYITDYIGLSGFTALHSAAGHGKFAAVQALLDAGAYVNAELHIDPKVYAGVNAEANQKLKNITTPLAFAVEAMKHTEDSVAPYQEVIRILKAHGAK